MLMIDSVESCVRFSVHLEFVRCSVVSGHSLQDLLMHLSVSGDQLVFE